MGNRHYRPNGTKHKGSKTRSSYLCLGAFVCKIAPVLIERVPNFSEGRKPEVVQALAEAARARGVTVLDLTMDADHHRSVLTFAGGSREVEAAAFDVAKKGGGGVGR